MSPLPLPAVGLPLPFLDLFAVALRWFLDAFNYALYLEIKVLNLSIGGPDNTDVRPNTTCFPILTAFHLWSS